MDRMKRTPIREQDPKVRAKNFEEVCYGYNEEEAVLEASRCLHCKNPLCVTGCPVGLHIPEFITLFKVKSSNPEPPCNTKGIDTSLLILSVINSSNPVSRKISTKTFEPIRYLLSITVMWKLAELRRNSLSHAYFTERCGMLTSCLKMKM